MLITLSKDSFSDGKHREDYFLLHSCSDGLASCHVKYTTIYNSWLKVGTICLCQPEWDKSVKIS